MSRWKSGWCGTGTHGRCVGTGPSPSSGGTVICSCGCHDKRRESIRQQWAGLR